MPFDADKFRKTEFCDRVEDVPVPDLKDWFNDDRENPVFQVRGLTGLELAVVREAVERNRSMDAIVSALASGQSKEQVDGIRKALGVSEQKSDDHTKRMKALGFGLVEPRLDKSLIHKLSENYPVTFYTLTQKVFELTGLGRLGESSASGTTPECGPV